jgi:hypothetical protein
MRFAPKIVDGTRGPRSDRLDEMRAQSEQEFDATPAEMPKVDGTVYLSAYPAYCVQITAPADLTDPVTGRKTIGRPMKAMFANGRYVNNARDKKVRAHIDEVLQSNSRFGRPGSGTDYWLAEQAIRMAQAAAKASALTLLKSMPREDVERFVAELQQGDASDVVMPAAPGSPATV